MASLSRVFCLIGPFLCKVWLRLPGFSSFSLSLGFTKDTPNLVAICIVVMTSVRHHHPHPGDRQGAHVSASLCLKKTSLLCVNVGHSLLPDSPGVPPSANAHELFRGFSYVAPTLLLKDEADAAGMVVSSLGLEDQDSTATVVEVDPETGLRKAMPPNHMLSVRVCLRKRGEGKASFITCLHPSRPSTLISSQHPSPRSTSCWR